MEGVIAKFVIQQGWPRLILMGSDYAAGHDAVSAVGSDLKLLHGSVVSEIFPRAGETDYAPYFSRLVDAEADAVYGFFFAGDTLRYVRQYKSSGLKLPLVITDNALASGGVAAALGSDIDGVYSVEYWIWTLTDPETIAFVRDYTKKFGMPPEGIAYCGYIEGRVMMEALKARHGVITNGEDLANAMKAVSFEAPGGPFKFDANNNPIVNGYLVHWAWNGSKPVPTVLETVRGITQDSIPAP
jgi:branched-chain amino acid transport system substrate-binding protein